MRLTEMVPNAPVKFPRTTRRDRGRVLTSADAGKALPIKAIPFLREDAMKRGKVRVNIVMQETAEMLMSGVQVRVMAHFVPMLAFERFSGSMEELNRSYMKETGIGGSVVPFFNTITGAEAIDTTAGDAATFLQTMGIHTQAGTINTTYRDAYNCIWNYRARARSAALTERQENDWSLAPAFWDVDTTIVPDFDQKLIDGQVPLQGLTFDGTLITKALNSADNHNREAVYGDVPSTNVMYSPSARGQNWTLDAQNDIYTAANQIFVELASDNATVSLADIEQAKKTAAFAKLRSMYDGLDSEAVIDLLMQGIRVPEEVMRNPMLIAKQTATISYAQRYATDAGNLDQSVTQGYATVDLNLRTPAMSTGGVLLITAEIVPEQMWERKKDYWLYETDPDNLPNALRDTLDPEAVSVVKNDHFDVNHSTPNGTFGYAPLNVHSYGDRNMVNIGGKYYRPALDTFTEDRQKLWSIEGTDPSLSQDFYLVDTLHKKVFVDQVSDSFEIMCISDCEITGNTVFGERLLEADATSDFEAITQLVDDQRIDK